MSAHLMFKHITPDPVPDPDRLIQPELNRVVAGGSNLLSVPDRAGNVWYAPNPPDCCDTANVGFEDLWRKADP